MKSCKSKLNLLIIGCGAALLAGCTGGIEFNGNAASQQISPRTEPIPHFPLPVEQFDENMYGPGDGGYRIADGTQGTDNVLAGGRPTASPRTDLGQPSWAEPEVDTTGMPADPASFALRGTPQDPTDVWATQGTENRNDPLTPIDEIEFWGTPAIRGASISIISQWLCLKVDGQARDDYPLTIENLEFQDVKISVIDSAGAAGILDTALQNPIDPTIEVFDPALNGEDLVLTSNEHAELDDLTTGGFAAPGPSGTANCIEYAMGITAPPPVLFSKWHEEEFENLFLESSFDSATGSTMMLNAPTSSYFVAGGYEVVSGGVYVDKIMGAFGTAASQMKLTAWTDLKTYYYAGAILGHVIGTGVGVAQSAFVRPGVTNGEEDIMNLNLELDLLFYIVADRRFQYTPEGLLHMQNIQSFPHGSQERTDAVTASLVDPFDEDGIRMMESAPGPLRQ